MLAGTIGSVTGTADFVGGPLSGATVSWTNGASVAASRGATATMSKLGLLLDWYPDVSRGWHAGASVGAGALDVRNLATDTRFTGFGLSGGVFAGYDWAFAPQWSGGLELAAEALSSAPLKRDRNDTGYELKGFWVGLQGSLLYF